MDPIQRQQQGKFDSWGDRKIETAINRRLADLGLSVNADGSFDQETVEALEQLQFHHGLPVTGKIDARTAALLEIEVSDRGFIIADHHGTTPLSRTAHREHAKSTLSERAFKNGTVEVGSMETSSKHAEVSGLSAADTEGGARHKLVLARGQVSLDLDSGRGLGAEASLIRTSSNFETELANFQLETRAAGAAAKAGFRNSDGSYGANAELSATAANIKTTISFGPSKENQITLGGGIGAGASGHIGVRDIDDDGYAEYCVAVGARLVDVGACRESFLRVHDSDGDGRLEVESSFQDGPVELPFVASPSEQLAVKLFNRIERALIEKSKQPD